LKDKLNEAMDLIEFFEDENIFIGAFASVNGSN
jgi:hypothetical protein